MENETQPIIEVTPVDSTAESKVGYADGTVLSTGEKIVYEYDGNGQFLGWHKEVTNG